MEVGRVLQRPLGQWPKSYCSREGYVEPVRLKHPAKVKQIPKTISNPRKNPSKQTTVNSYKVNHVVAPITATVPDMVS